MGVWSRLKSVCGYGNRTHTITLTDAAAATIELSLPSGSNLFTITTATEGIDISHLHADGSTQNRIVTLVGIPVVDTNGYTTLKNNSNPTTAGHMDLGGSDIALDESDSVTLLLKPDKTWVRISSVDN